MRHSWFSLNQTGITEAEWLDPHLPRACFLPNRSAIAHAHIADYLLEKIHAAFTTDHVQKSVTGPYLLNHMGKKFENLTGNLPTVVCPKLGLWKRA